MRILVVDDSRETRALVRIALEAQGHEVFEAPDGVSAIPLALARRPEVVVLDVMMPGPDGYTVCYLIKTTPQLRGTKVVLLTALGKPGDRIAGRGAAADAYLAKPFDPERLNAAIARLAGGAQAAHA